MEWYVHDEDSSDPIEHALVTDLSIANKDIALLCALTKECRKDKFRISWDRVAKWIGPNVTGGAIEQHVAKLYSKLKEHRSSQEPKRKKRKNASYTDEDDNEGDYVEDEETWNKGNEAFANIFYASPDASSGMLDDENDFDFDQAAHARDFYHKESSANYQEEYDDDENDRGGLMHAAQSYGGMGARQSFQEGYGGLGGPGEGIRSAPLHHGYADPPSEGGHSNYSIDCKWSTLEILSSY